MDVVGGIVDAGMGAIVVGIEVMGDVDMVELGAKGLCN